MPIKPSMHPETYSELVARSLRLYRGVFPQAFGFALLISIVLFIPRLICVAIGQNVFLTTTKVNQVALLYFAMYLSALWFLAALFWCINCLERGVHKNFIDDVEMAGKRICYVLGAAVILFLLSSLVGLLAYLVNEWFWHLKLYSYDKFLTSFLFFVVCFAQVGVSVWLATLFYFYFPLIVIEHNGILNALKQSAQLVYGKVGQTLRLQLTPWLLYFLVLILIKMVFKLNIHIYFMPQNPGATFYPTLVHIVVLALFIPWGSSMALVQLRDYELRRTVAQLKK